MSAIDCKHVLVEARWAIGLIASFLLWAAVAVWQTSSAWARLQTVESDLLKAQVRIERLEISMERVARIEQDVSWLRRTIERALEAEQRGKK